MNHRYSGVAILAFFSVRVVPRATRGTRTKPRCHSTATTAVCRRAVRCDRSVLRGRECRVRRDHCKNTASEVYQLFVTTNVVPTQVDPVAFARLPQRTEERARELRSAPYRRWERRVDNNLRRQLPAGAECMVPCAPTMALSRRSEPARSCGRAHDPALADG